MTAQKRCFFFERQGSRFGGRLAANAIAAFKRANIIVNLARRKSGSSSVWYHANLIHKLASIIIVSNLQFVG
jgi:hypothetical protein